MESIETDSPVRSFTMTMTRDDNKIVLWLLTLIKNIFVSSAEATSSHFIFVLLLHLTEFALEINSDLDIQVPHVPLIGRETEDSRELLALGAGEVVLQVEHGLLPVGVGSLRGRGEANPLVAVGELDIEEGHQGLNVVISSNLKAEGGLERNLFLPDGLDVDLSNEAVVGNHLISVHRIHDGLGESDLPDGGHIEPVDVIPPVDLVLLVLSVLDGGDVEGGLVGEHQTSGLQPLVPGEQDGVQHGLIEQAVAHPLGDDDVNLLYSIRQTDLLL